DLHEVFLPPMPPGIVPSAYRRRAAARRLIERSGGRCAGTLLDCRPGGGCRAVPGAELAYVWGDMAVDLPAGPAGAAGRAGPGKAGPADGPGKGPGSGP